MRKTQTREQLYELVWSKPRTVIARELGISDVRLGKLCRDLDVPAPPRGYWANRDSRRKRRKFEKPPSPIPSASAYKPTTTPIGLAAPPLTPRLSKIRSPRPRRLLRP